MHAAVSEQEIEWTIPTLCLIAIALATGQA